MARLEEHTEALQPSCQGADASHSLCWECRKQEEKALPEQVGLTCRKRGQEMKCLGLTAAPALWANVPFTPAGSHLMEMSHNEGHMLARPALQNSLLLGVWKKSQLSHLPGP